MVPPPLNQLLTSQSLSAPDVVAFGVCLAGLPFWPPPLQVRVYLCSGRGGGPLVQMGEAPPQYKLHGRVQNENAMLLALLRAN